MSWFSAIKKRWKQNKRERYQEEFRQNFEDTLAIHELETVHVNLIKHLHVALNPEYMEEVNTAFRLKFPRYSQRQVNELWRELKRYFVLAAIFKQVEMFHDKVDELWHLMLDDPNKYNQFCQTFIGHKIEHIPHKQPTWKPTERTLFDFYYVQLFTVDMISLKIWRKFFKEDKGISFLNEFTSRELTSLKQTYMRTNTSQEAEQTFEFFVARLKDAQKEGNLHWKKQYEQTDNASPAYFAYVEADEDAKHEFKDIFGGDSTDSGSSSDSASSHNHNDSGSDTSSCSSCSSCSSS